MCLAALSSQAGLQVGNIITRIDNTSLDDTHAYLNTLFQYSAGDSVILTIMGNGRKIQCQPWVNQGRREAWEMDCETKLPTIR